MTGTPEDPEPPPFSPSIFLDLPPSPRGEDGDDPASSSRDLVLPFISRMLMEEDDTDEQLYPSDHPALLTVQQPFARILSAAAAVAPSSGANTTTSGDQPDGLSQLQQATRLLQTPPPFADHVSDGALISALFGCRHSNGGGDEDKMLIRLAFLKGMEEANKFLPMPTSTTTGTSGSREKQPKNEKNRRRRNEDDAACRFRNTRLMTVSSSVPAAAEEQTGGEMEMVDQMIVNGFNVCIAKVKRPPHWHCTTTGAGGSDDGGAAGDLPTLLVHCAQAVGADDRCSAAQLLAQIKRQSSPRGDPNQRLAHCFAEGLVARLAGTTGAHQLRRSITSSAAEYLRALQLYLESCCFKTTSLSVANWSIVKAVAATGRKRLHIVDFGIDYGTQWPTLLACLAAMDGGPPEVRITGVDLPRPGLWPCSRLQETGRRLGACARRLGVPFKFRGVAAARWETVRAGDLDVDPDELLFVNSVGSLGFGSLMDMDDEDVRRPSPRDAVLGNVREMRPHMFVLCVANASHRSPFFVQRFQGALSYYSAMFDMLDATMPRDNQQRLLLERDLFGRCALNVVACEGADRVERPEAYREWRARCHRAGLRQLPLDAEIVQFVRDKVKRLYHKEFVFDVDRHWLIQGWKGRVLYAMSTWVAHD